MWNKYEQEIKALKLFYFGIWTSIYQRSICLENKFCIIYQETKQQIIIKTLKVRK